MRWTWFEDVTGQWLDKSINAFFERPDVQASVERGQRLTDVAEQAREIARSDIDDTTACDQLSKSLPDDRELARDVVELLAERRTSYVEDRAYRLLCASLDGCLVRPIDPGVREQFLAEAELGRRSLTDAFEVLAALEPRLRERALRRIVVGRKGRSGWGISRTQILVGRWARSPHPILNTDLAEEVVSEYRAVIDEGPGADDQPSTPVCDREPTPVEGFERFLFAEDPRPRANN
ncbi:MAG: hypothetical protein ACLP0J_12880 [Solirubrobacteraceae bacterium]